MSYVDNDKNSNVMLENTFELYVCKYYFLSGLKHVRLNKLQSFTCPIVFFYHLLLEKDADIPKYVRLTKHLEKMQNICIDRWMIDRSI